MKERMQQGEREQPVELEANEVLFSPRMKDDDACVREMAEVRSYFSDDSSVVDEEAWRGKGRGKGEERVSYG